jgi:nitrous oxide reductase
MMKKLNRFILFISIFLAFPASVYAEGITYPSSGVFKFQHKLATKGNARAQYKLGTMYEYGKGIELDIEKAKHWYGLASTAGIKAADDRIIYLSIKEQGYDQAKYSAWLKAIEKEAGKSNGDSMFVLAQLYREGLGVNKDLNRALEILDRVSLLGAADVEDEMVLIQAEIEANSKVDEVAQRRNEKEHAARLSQQERQQQVKQKQNKEQQIAQQEQADKVRLAAKIRRYEKVMMKLKLEQELIDKQQAWASGGATTTVDDEF